ncbi:MAG: NADH-quinone oxidoreductase subunit C [Gammaproteobacteria bacterium]
MPQSPDQLAARLKESLGDRILSGRLALGEVTVELAPSALIEVCQSLRDDPAFAFEQLMDVCGVDYLTYGQGDWQTETATTSGFSRGVSRTIEEKSGLQGPRFAVVYHLLSLKHNGRLRLRVFPEGDPPTIDSVVEIWNSADWFEREAFDLYGILFEGHPDLRRILTDYGFIGHPFRKDFPLEGKVEVRYDPEKGRVVYQPVTIQNRVLVPRVIRREAERHSDAVEGSSHG